MKVGNLKPEDKNHTLLCLQCHSTYSANPSDYWDSAADRELSCCSSPLTLVRAYAVYEPVERT